MDRKVKGIALGVTAVIVIGVIFIYNQLLKPLQGGQASDSIIIAEGKLIDDHTVYVAYLDINRIHHLYKKYLKPEIHTEPSAPLQVTDVQTFVAQLYSEGIDLFAQTSTAFFVLDSMNNQEKQTNKTISQLKNTLLLDGTFAADKIVSSIKRHMLAHKIAKNAHIYRVTPPKNIETCEKGEVFDIFIERDTILITSEGQIQPTLKKLVSNAKPTQNGKKWREYRAEQLVAQAIFNPHKATSAIQNPFARMMLSSPKTQEGTNPFKRAFIGLELDVLSQSIDADIKVWSDKKHAQKAHKDFSDFVSKAKENFPTEPKEMSVYKNILDSLSSEVDGDLITLNLNLNADHIESLKKLPQNIGTFISSSMGMTGMTISSSNNKDSKPQKDSLKDEASTIQYKNNLNVDNLNTKAVDMFNLEGVKVGPFIINAMVPQPSPWEQKDDNKDLTVIRTKVDSGIVPNMNAFMHDDDKNPRATLHIKSVLDGAKQNILKVETCGRDRNNKPKVLNAFQHTQYEGNKQTAHTRLSGFKDLRLKDGVKLERAKEVHGFIQLRIPSMIQETILPAQKGETYSYKDATVNIEKAEYNDLTYVISGEKSTILNVVPLNKDKKVLEVNTKSAMGDQVTQYVQGTPKFVKIIVATQEQTRTYPFIAPLKHEE